MAPIVGEWVGVNLIHRLPLRFIPLSEGVMSDEGLVHALDRADRALSRVERALSNLRSGSGRDDQLREKVRDVVAELDSLIASSGAR